MIARRIIRSRECDRDRPTRNTHHEELGAKLWQMMDEEEIKEVSQVMSNLGSVSAILIEKLLVDFVSQMSGTGSIMGSYESTERLLANILPEDKVGSIMEEIRMEEIYLTKLCPKKSCPHPSRSPRSGNPACRSAKWSASSLP